MLGLLAPENGVEVGRPKEMNQSCIAFVKIKFPSFGPRNNEGSRKFFNPLTPNDPYSGRTAPLTSKSCILYIYSTNIGTEYFKHGIYSPLFFLQNAVCFIILKYLVPALF